ncbi:molybdopterin-binding protein [Alkaliphilus sp. B6464]|uniref:molybdopterin-binding protein n=1 Tax=Alkaliphilus sp. B6464 TaxID=2731219 RepID=UPI0020139CF2|nr:molybdopterin-binding protein [Alkaliphilus sp. B6464]
MPPFDKSPLDGFAVRLEDIKGTSKENPIDALGWADLVITTGGVSVGDCDLVKEAFQQAGAEMLFWRVRMKPGTPIAVAKFKNKLIFGLS